MKKIILAITALALAGTSVQTASAGGCSWSTAGQVFAGLTAGVVIGQALAPRPVYCAAPAPVYCLAPGYGYTCVYPAPARPVVVYSAPAPVFYAAPAPVVAYRPPVCVAPPIISVGFGYLGGCRPRYYHRGCW